MTAPKRPRGRPRGSVKNDMPALIQVAELLAGDASLKPTTAMKRVMQTRKDWQSTDVTLLRRWQGKWAVQGDELLASARERRARKPAPVGSGLDTLLAFHEKMRQIAESPELVRFLETWGQVNIGVQKALQSPEWQQFFERVAVFQEKINRAALDPNIQRALQNVAGYQKQIEQVRLISATHGFRR